MGTVCFCSTVPFSFSQSNGLSPIIPNLKLYSNNNFKRCLKVSGEIFSQSSSTRYGHLISEKINNMTSYYGFDSVYKKDTTQKKHVDNFKMKKDPWLAVLFSIIPGGGQFYNESYWKVPILLGLCSYFAYSYYDENQKFKSYRDQYNASIEQYPPDGDLNLKALREFYRNQRNDFTWYFITVYFIGFVDAYVDAHLFDFDIRDEKMNSLGNIDRKYKLNFHLNF